ncbi:hypothetical protein FIBSPDRAFT_946607 [Athelia psychrophila]|uniref:Uncharacterized protein n=1 Tax=Athelia psychrophila TaxID=1759441 RepID=A0A166SQZ1_9AGAM|nr:hypothetical protein FIBSPDRAFT_946607 [Fibularhizoctonia sp. CBS 109695]
MGRRKYAEAETLYQQALEGQEQQLGADHPSTLATAHNLSVLYMRQGNHDNAAALFQRALVQQRQLGADHPETLYTVHNLAVLYNNQGYYDAAESLYQRSLAEQERKLGADHPDVLLMGQQPCWTV